jgi:hypothetical protein
MLSYGPATLPLPLLDLAWSHGSGNETYLLSQVVYDGCTSSIIIKPGLFMSLFWTLKFSKLSGFEMRFQTLIIFPQTVDENMMLENLGRFPNVH